MDVSFDAASIASFEERFATYRLESGCRARNSFSRHVWRDLAHEVTLAGLPYFMDAPGRLVGPTHVHFFNVFMEVGVVRGTGATTAPARGVT
jgi:hypothetical protein